MARPLPYSCLFAVITSLIWYYDNNFSVLGCLFLFLLVITTSVFLGECHCCYCKSGKCLIVLPSIYGISLFFHNIKQRKTEYFFLVYWYVGILPFLGVHESYLYFTGSGEGFAVCTTSRAQVSAPPNKLSSSLTSCCSHERAICSALLLCQSSFH